MVVVSCVLAYAIFGEFADGKEVESNQCQYDKDVWVGVT